MAPMGAPTHPQARSPPSPPGTSTRVRYEQTGRSNAGTQPSSPSMTSPAVSSLRSPSELLRLRDTSRRGSRMLGQQPVPVPVAPPAGEPAGTLVELRPYRVANELVPDGPRTSIRGELFGEIVHSGVERLGLGGVVRG